MRSIRHLKTVMGEHTMADEKMALSDVLRKGGTGSDLPAREPALARPRTRGSRGQRTDRGRAV